MNGESTPISQGRRLIIVRIESYEGADTFLRCGTELQDHLFAIVAVEPSGRAELVDCGYRTRDEAARSWDLPVA